MKNYYLLGRSGLRVSPLCLGTMTFGTEWGWGSPEETAKRILDRYLDRGGNFIDTADGYTGGHSEEMLGTFLKESGKRDRVVLATKYTFNNFSSDPNGGGNARKNMRQAVEASLRRLKTDYIDLYWMHAWDTLTPVDEVMRSFDELVRDGKVRYIGLSDTPAWYLTRAQTLAEWRGWERICALQLEYSLVERNIEREHIPAALELGMGVCPWSPLAGGFLSGKYRRSGERVSGDGRLEIQAKAGNTLFNRYLERNWKILDVLVAASKEMGHSASQVALNWITKRPGVTSTIIGATKMDQLDDNLAALDFEIPAEWSRRLEEASRPERVFPHNFFAPEIQDRVRGGVPIAAEPPWFRTK